jgi:hypothetical protein
MGEASNTLFCGGRSRDMERGIFFEKPKALFALRSGDIIKVKTSVFNATAVTMRRIPISIQTKSVSSETSDVIRQ